MRSRWRSGGAASRPIAALLAVLPPLGLAWALSFVGPPPADAPRAFATMAVLAVPLPRSTAGNPAPAVARPLLRSPLLPQPLAASVHPAGDPVSPAPADTPSEATAPADVASGPLRVSPQDVQRAMAAARHPVWQQAERAGQRLNPEPVSPQERLGASIARAAKPDCFGKEQGAAGMFALVAIPVQIARDSCKMP